MSTHAGIGMLMPDGKVKAIFLHFDGYPSGAGTILFGCYNTQEKVEKLIALSHLSAVGTKWERDRTKKFDRWDPYEDITIAYHRDYGEEFQPPLIYDSKEDFSQNGKGDFDASYLYLFENGKWFVKGIYNTEGWIELTVEVCEEY